jgi:small subunit ribosomal protein S9
MSTNIANVRYFYGVGRRKRSTARAKYYPTDEELTILVNKREFLSYFPEHFSQVITTALKNLGIEKGTVHFFINGGGISGQADAARLAVSKSLVLMQPDLKPIARSFKYLTTDIRKVLPKKSGLRKARKAEQWSKR